MENPESREFTELGVKPWLVKQLATLGKCFGAKFPNPNIVLGDEKRDMELSVVHINECQDLSDAHKNLDLYDLDSVTTPTPVQKGCIPRILAGSDCIGAAKTGSGKTFAFALPILQHLAEDPYGIFALILTPTHELAYQIADQLSIVGQPLSLRVCIVTGGSDQLEESQKLARRPHVVVAMPGRLADHLTGCNTFTLKKIKYLVMDEADRLFGDSFEEDLQTVFNALPQQRQNLLFSATLSEEVVQNKNLTLNREKLLIWKEGEEQPTVETLDQRYVLCPPYARDVYLVQTLRTFRRDSPSGHVIIFTDTKKDCQVLSMTLNAVGIENVCLHGYMRQRERVAALTQFRSDLKSTLVATNVAARGLDIPTVKLVMNHKLPLHPNEYIHRVGRTARAGRSGLAISLLTPYDLPRLEVIEKAINTKLTEYTIDDDEAVKVFTTISVARREQEATLDNEDFEQRKRNYRIKRWLQAGLDPAHMEQGFEEMRRKRVKAAKKAKLARIQQKQSELKIQEDENKVENRLQPEDERDEEIDASIKKGLKRVNKKLMKRDDRFKNAIGKISKIKRKADGAARREQESKSERNVKNNKKKIKTV